LLRREAHRLPIPEPLMMTTHRLDKILKQLNAGYEGFWPVVSIGVPY